jgi:hypothetical protein
MSTSLDPKAGNDINDRLAKACQATCSSCCKKGKIFLPKAEYNAIRNWVTSNSPSELDEFDSRIEEHGSFNLYDQRDSCQFLDKDDLCRLHSEGVKPRECFWWPLHIYTADSGELDIRVSTSCCDAYKLISKDSPYVDSLEGEVRNLGSQIIRDFRAVYPGSYSGVSLRRISVD